MSLLVSVVVPTKNSARTLEKCLQSIRSQSHQSVELIVVDNGSNDQTKHIAKHYADNVFEIGPERSAQRNFGVEKARGKYVAIIDSDMYLDRSVLAECVSVLETGSNTRGIVIPEESVGIGFWAHCKQLERSYYVGIPYMEAARFFKRADFIDIGGYDTALVSGEDWDFSQRMQTLGNLGRTKARIKHDEGRLSLRTTMRKKAYYAGLFSAYTNKATTGSAASKQTNIIGRYALFFQNPAKILAHPILWIGMIVMKTCEFGAGAYGIICAKSQKTTDRI
jgi:glycosyltransferase involved in cell wall biosynthesis